MKLLETARYAAVGLDGAGQDLLARFGDILLEAELNVTAIRDPAEIERQHFLDSLSLLDVPSVVSARTLVDVGSGGGLPAIVLALATEATIVALESQRKKCDFIQKAAQSLGLGSVVVHCARAEEYGRGDGREVYDVAVSRALAPLSVVAEYSLPLIAKGGTMVAMKGRISNQELIQAQHAVGILGGGALEAVKLEPFPGAENRWVYVSEKISATPAEFPRRTGIPAKRPLGS